MKKRIISFVIVCLLSLSWLTVLSSADAQLSNANDVITPELREVMNASKAADKIPVSVWTDEIDAAEVEELALKKTGYNKESIRALVEQGKGDTVTLDDVNEYIAVERKLYAEKQQSANQKFAQKYTFLNEAKTQKDAYVCSYAPMIVVSLTKSQIETLAKDSAVNTMYYSPKTESKNEMDVSIPLINAKYNRDTSGYTGQGVRIGMVESAIPDSSKFTLVNSNIITTPTTLDALRQIYVEDYDGAFEDAVDHATRVAEIMVSTFTGDGGIYRGIVPEAQLYCFPLHEDYGWFYGAVESLLQQNVTVINMSAEVYNTINPARGQYTDYERWIDHIAHNHSVHFVKSAGNNGNLVTHPGLAYNIVTVGAIDDKNTQDNLSDDVICNFSSYNETANTSGITPPNKPDLVAPGYLIRLQNSAANGTSFAAPHVTGVIAQLIDQYPALAVLQDLMKAMLTAAVSHDYISYTPYQTSLFEKYGAGLVDAKACSEISYRGTFVSSTFTAAQNNYTKTYTFNATTSDNKIRVSLAWLKSVWFSGSDHLSNTTPGTDAPLANLDLIVIRPNGLELPMCQYENYDLNTNLVIIEFDPEVYGYGTYTVKIKIHDSTGTPTYFGIAWWADRN